MIGMVLNCSLIKSLYGIGIFIDSMNVILPPGAEPPSDGWCEVKKSGNVLGGFGCNNTETYSAKTAVMK